MAKKAKATPKPKKQATETQSVKKPRAKAAPKTAGTAPKQKKTAKKTAPKKMKVPAVVTETVVTEVAATAPLSARFASFDEAKNATLDALLEIIELAEQRLCEVKRVDSFEDLEPLANGHL